jgi:2-polyprenyl-6-hydroxyphenyl methylase/3-demethylubiquinone-9 3-methyltransferase
LSRFCREAGLTVTELIGLTYNPITRRFSLTSDCDVNYLVACRKGD